mmetsp:Transcript_2540/g.3838  ORF Transcript_2540/g.3838 Transcript_2540/m.3838 type:complete len:124 (+) Transcript_2540:417-788(+)
MGILLVYDVTDENSFQNIRNWVRNIEQHAADNVDKILIGNKSDMKDQKVVDTARGEELARHYGIKFFETSAKTNENVKEAFYAISKDIKKRLMDTNPKGDSSHGGGGTVNLGRGSSGGGGCCK